MKVLSPLSCAGFDLIAFNFFPKIKKLLLYEYLKCSKQNINIFIRKILS